MIEIFLSFDERLGLAKVVSLVRTVVWLEEVEGCQDCYGH